MIEINYEEFNKRYDKYKHNNLPTPFYDEERLTKEYVYFYNDRLEVENSLIYALDDFINDGLYYPFNDKHVIIYKEGRKRVEEVVVGHNHAHLFEEVVEALYDSPESFSIQKEDEVYYSKQELELLKRIQKYLLFIGMKDLGLDKRTNKRYNNKVYKKYKDALVYNFSTSTINKIKNNNIDFFVKDYYPEYMGDKKYKRNEYKVLCVDENEDYKLFIEVKNREVKKYKDIKNIYTHDNIKDDDNVIVYYFKVLDIFE